MPGDRLRRARESVLSGPPKEQPPRNLSGIQDRAGRIDTLESASVQTGATEGVTLAPMGDPGESSQVP